MATGTTGNACPRVWLFFVCSAPYKFKHPPINTCVRARESQNKKKKKKREATRLPCKRSWLLFWLRNWIRQFDKIALFPGRRHCWWWRLVKQNYGAKARLQKKRVIYTATATHTYRQAALLCVKLLLVLLPLGGTYVVCPHVANTWCVMWRTIFLCVLFSLVSCGAARRQPVVLLWMN